MSQLTERREIEDNIIQRLNTMARDPHNYTSGEISWLLKVAARAVRGDELLFEDEEYSYIVTVKGCTKEEADRVINERLDCDEDYGFDYTIEYEVTP